MTPPSAPIGGVVLCGGQSRRMGESKAWLDFQGEPMLVRVVRQLLTVVGPCVVVRAPQQALPALPPGVAVLDDPIADRGPLQGIARGLEALAPQCRMAFVASTDMPFIHPGFIKRLVELSADRYDIVVPRTGGYAHPLAALYATALYKQANTLLADDKRRPVFLFDEATTLHADADLLLQDETLRTADPGLDSLRNLNPPEDARAARLSTRGDGHS